MSPFLRIFCVIVCLYIVTCHAVNFTFNWITAPTETNTWRSFFQRLCSVLQISSNLYTFLILASFGSYLFNDEDSSIFAQLKCSVCDIYMATFWRLLYWMFWRIISLTWRTSCKHLRLSSTDVQCLLTNSPVLFLILISSFLYHFSGGFVLYCKYGNLHLHYDLI